jgi:hypothetical protein
MCEGVNQTLLALDRIQGQALFEHNNKPLGSIAVGYFFTLIVTVSYKEGL